MLLRNSKTLIYITLFVFTLSFILPITSFAFDSDSIYVWSNNASSVSTSTTTDSESSEEPKDNSR